eukprot:ANDGO_07394.mRNA.1 Putative ankyrin repeat protein FPV023
MALHDACICGDVARVQSLLDSGWDASQVDYEWEGKTALHVTAMGQNDAAAAEIVRLLVAKGVSVNAKKAGSTPLYYACDNGLKLTAQALLELGADPNTSNGDEGETPLCKACSEGHMELVDVLLQAGANVNLPDKADQSPLIYAVHGRPKLAVMKRLIEHGADVNLGDYATPLGWAIDAKSINAAILLLDAGADPAKSCELFGTPLEQCPNPESEFHQLILSRLQ